MPIKRVLLQKQKVTNIFKGLMKKKKSIDNEILARVTLVKYSFLFLTAKMKEKEIMNIFKNLVNNKEVIEKNW